MRRTNHDTTHLLRWYFQEAAGDVSGLKSSWEALWDMAQSGAVRQGAAGRSRTPTPRQFRSAGMESDIAARLELLDREHRVVLLAAHGPYAWHLAQTEDEDDRREHKVVYSRRAAQERSDRERFGKHPVVAMLTEAAREAWGERGGIAGFVEWLRNGALGDELLAEIRQQAEALVKVAEKAWEAVAPPAREDGSLKHNRRRRAAYGPTGQAEEGHRPSGVYPKYEPAPMPSVLRRAF